MDGKCFSRHSIPINIKKVADNSDLGAADGGLVKYHWLLS